VTEFDPLPSLAHCETGWPTHPSIGSGRIRRKQSPAREQPDVDRLIVPKGICAEHVSGEALTPRGAAAQRLRHG